MARRLEVGDEVQLTVEHIRAIGAQTEPDIYNDVGVVTGWPEAFNEDREFVRVAWDIRGRGKLVRASNLEVTRGA